MGIRHGLHLISFRFSDLGTDGGPAKRRDATPSILPRRLIINRCSNIIFQFRQRIPWMAVVSSRRWSSLALRPSSQGLIQGNANLVPMNFQFYSVRGGGIARIKMQTCSLYRRPFITLIRDSGRHICEYRNYTTATVEDNTRQVSADRKLISIITGRNRYL